MILTGGIWDLTTACPCRCLPLCPWLIFVSEAVAVAVTSLRRSLCPLWPAPSPLPGRENLPINTVFADCVEHFQNVFHRRFFEDGVVAGSGYVTAAGHHNIEDFASAAVYGFGVSVN